MRLLKATLLNLPKQAIWFCLYSSRQTRLNISIDAFGKVKYLKKLDKNFGCNKIERAERTRRDRLTNKRGDRKHIYEKIH